MMVTNFSKMLILFVCDFNKGRSQMAEAFFKKRAPEIDVKSAGIKAELVGKRLRQVNPRVVKFMKEIGYNVGWQKVKQLTPSDVKAADRIIVMTDGDLPDYLKDSYKITFWSIKNFDRENDDSYRMLRDKIKVLVDELVDELDG